MLLYNTLTRKKEKFRTLSENNVLMYVCGITPYDTTHIGHAFLYMFFDVFSRYLNYKGLNVKYVQNVTDIDDDILKRAKEEKRDWKELGQFWTERFLKDYALLNMQLPTEYVKATDTIDVIVEMVGDLLKKGFAYESGNNIYFEVNRFKNYGKLSRLNERQMTLIAKERGGDPDDPKKRSPLDFLLWQRSKEGEPSWESPWGKGRPGWHIECSAMSYKHLGAQIDIHGGGYDLTFPHHESEIAQSESFTGKSPFVQYWLHASMVLCEGEKMSKSLGNMVFVSDLLKNYSADSIRWVLLSHHYRKPWQFETIELSPADEKLTELAESLKQPSRGDLKKVEEYLDNDMDTPSALEYLERETAGAVLRKGLMLLGFQMKNSH